MALPVYAIEMRKLIVTLLLLPVFLLASLPASVPAADDLSALLAKVKAAYGGKAAMAKMKSMRQEGTVDSPMWKTKGPILRVIEGRQRLRIEIAYAGRPKEVRILDGAKGWRDGVTMDSGPAFDAMVLQGARMSLPSSMLASAKNLKLVDQAASGGTTMRVVEWTLGKGIYLIVEIEASTGRIVRVTGRAPGGGMVPGKNEIEFINEFSDFKTVDGVLVPFRETSFANGFKTGETTLSKVEFPATIAKEVFAP